jgi:hypothetical protein
MGDNAKNAKNGKNAKNVNDARIRRVGQRPADLAAAPADVNPEPRFVPPAEL